MLEISPKPSKPIFPQLLFAYFRWLMLFFDCSLSCRKQHFSVANEISEVSPKPLKVLSPFNRYGPLLMVNLHPTLYCQMPKQSLLVANELLRTSPKPSKAKNSNFFNHSTNKDLQFISHLQIFHDMTQIIHTIKINLFWEITEQLHSQNF